MALAEADLLFKKFEYDMGSKGGARERFQSFATSLISVEHPSASEVAGPGGDDWGIDTYVGQLDKLVVAWQTKFFISWDGASQQKQTRESFEHLMRKSVEEGVTVSAWTLVVPCILPPEQQLWFDRWATRQRNKYKLRISIWNAVTLRNKLLKPDYAAVRAEYFPESILSTDMGSPYLVETTDDVTFLNEALFVRQLEAAGHRETDAARGLFFAAEALARDIASQNDPRLDAALKEISLDVHGIWENEFNVAAQNAGASELHSSVVGAVISAAGKCQDSPPLHLRPAHRKGLVHRLVEDSKAGWVRGWRDIVESHESPPAGTIVAAYLSQKEVGERA